MLRRLDALERELVVGRLQASVGKLPDRASEEDAGRTEETSLVKSRINRNGLNLGTEAPEFSLPRLHGGGAVSIADFRGSPFVLVLVSPDCGPCEVLIRRLTRLDKEYVAGSVLVVARGTAQANQKKFAPDCAFSVVLQDGWEISRRYATFKLPSGYLIDAEGVIQSHVVTGPAEILDLVFEAMRDGPKHQIAPWIHEPSPA